MTRRGKPGRNEYCDSPYEPPRRAVPLYVDLALFERVRTFADREGTSPNFAAARLLDDALTARGVKPKRGLTPDDRLDPA